MKDKIIKALDKACAVNLSEPSPGDLGRIYKAYCAERAARQRLESALEAIKAHTLHPDVKPSVWNDYLQDLLQTALSEARELLKGEVGK